MRHMGLEADVEEEIEGSLDEINFWFGINLSYIDSWTRFGITKQWIVSETKYLK